MSEANSSVFDNNDTYSETTETPDYSFYYDEKMVFPTPCNNVDIKQFGQVFLPVFYSLVFILGFLGNGLVVCVLVKHRNQSNLTDICLFNLALSDLLFVLTLPFYSHFSAMGVWTLGDFLCHFISGFHYIGYFSSIFFMVAMTLDRYLMIKHAHTVGRYRTWRASVFVTMLIWLLSVCASVPPFMFTKVTNESHGLSCSYSREAEDKHPYVPFATNIMGLLVPLSVMVLCYCRIIPTLVNMRTAKKHRVVKLIISIVIVFFLFWGPYNICIFMKFLQQRQHLPSECHFDQNLRLAVTVTEVIAYTHCCLNPIIYAFVGQKFMRRAKHLLSKWVPRGVLPSTRDISDSSYRKSSIASRSSEVSTAFAM